MKRQSLQTRRGVTGWLWPLAGAFLALAGCASGESTSGSSGLDKALENYQASRYAMAGEQAAAVQRRVRGQQQFRAAYLEGLCAYQLGDFERAHRPLSQATASSDTQTAANARAVLGLVLLELGRPTDAAMQLSRAAGTLSGSDARQASRLAAVAYERAGDDVSAADWKLAASESEPGGTGGFTLQVGAFRERPHAEKAARHAAEIAEDHGLAPVRIVPRRDDHGVVVYLVQLGRFDTRDAAAAGRKRLGNLQYIVAAWPES